jgi:hypothetical protein
MFQSNPAVVPGLAPGCSEFNSTGRSRALEQSRAGMADKGLSIAGIGLEHLEAAVAGHVGDLDQVGAALHRAGHEAGAQAVAAEGRRVEAELGGVGAAPIVRRIPDNTALTFSSPVGVS